MASARLQRWALTLSAYTYTIKYKSGKQQGNADTLSRFPLADVPTSVSSAHVCCARFFIVLRVCMCFVISLIIGVLCLLLISLKELDVNGM